MYFIVQVRHIPLGFPGIHLISELNVFYSTHEAEYNFNVMEYG